MQVHEYAGAVGYSTGMMSKVINGKQPGTLKLLILCIHHAGGDLQDYLRLPVDVKTEHDERAHAMFNGLNESRRELVLRVLHELAAHQALESKLERSKRGK